MAGTPQGTTGGSGPARAILVVEDEESLRGLLVAALERQGFEVIAAPDGPEAVALFREQPERISLVLLDLTLPRLPGEDVLRELRLTSADVPVIAMSGHGEHVVRERLAGATVSALLQKPYRPSELVAVVRTVLGG